MRWDSGDGNDIIEGQGGNGTLRFNGSNVCENIDLSANGWRLRLTRDIGSVVLDADGIEQVDLAVLGGTDDITINTLAGTAVTQVNTDLIGAGGLGDAAFDTVTVKGTAVPGVTNLIGVIVNQ